MQLKYEAKLKHRTLAARTQGASRRGEDIPVLLEVSKEHLHV